MSTGDLMKFEIVFNGKIKKYDGLIRQINNVFYVDLEVPNTEELNNIILEIKGYYEPYGDITLINNYNVYEGASIDSNYIKYTYKCGYLITGHVDSKKLLLRSLQLYYKELDYYFVKDNYSVDFKGMNKKFKIIQKYGRYNLFENENFKLMYNRGASLQKDEYGQKIFSNPAYITYMFNKEISLSNIDEYISDVETCFGFVLNQKLSLISIYIIDSKEQPHRIILPNMFNYKDVKCEESFIVEFNSNKLLKNIINSYFSNEFIKATINTYYEYLFNNLNYVFKFTSLVNSLELICCHDKYKYKIEKYTLKNNQQLRENNKKIENIKKKLNEDEIKILNGIYNCKFVTLRDKLNYIFYSLFCLDKNDKSENYITKIVSTRTYYVHGTRKNKHLSSCDLVITTNLLKEMLYNMIVYCCTKRKNFNFIVDTNEMLIQNVYNNINSID